MEVIPRSLNPVRILLVAALLSTGLVLPSPAADGPAPWSHLDFQDDPEDFRFAIVPDRGGGDFRGAFTNALRCVNLMRPAFVMSVGDLITGLKPPAILRRQQTELTNFVSRVEAPFFYVVGNHDITRSRACYTNNHEESSAVWREYHGAKTYYSFVYKRCLFVALDTMEGRDARQKQCGMTEEQYAWFRRTLDEHADVRWTFVFMHQPNEWKTSGWEACEKSVLAKRPYTVFAGDWHEYLHAKRYGRDYYILSVAGGVSANNKEDSKTLLGPEYGEMDHITWVTMQKDGPHVVNLKLDGIFAGDYLNQRNTKAPPRKWSIGKGNGK